MLAQSVLVQVCVDGVPFEKRSPAVILGTSGLLPQVQFIRPADCESTTGREYVYLVITGIDRGVCPGPGVGWLVDFSR